MKRSWLQMIWTQVFRDDVVVGATDYLQGNFTAGLFLMVLLVARADHPEQLGVAPAALIALAALALVGGYPLGARMRRFVSPIVFAQALCLLIALVALVCITVSRELQDKPLINFRYVPGLPLCSIVYASLQLEFMGPASWRAWHPKRFGLALGAVCELSLDAVLVWRLAH